jgi:hypothetical protein
MSTEAMLSIHDAELGLAKGRRAGFSNTARGDHMKTGRREVLLGVSSCALAALLAIQPGAALAEDQVVSKAQLARHELWLSWSATLVLGSIAGSFALKVAALNDRIDLLPRNTIERPDLQDDAVSARRLAWGFGSAASLLALTSVLIWVYQPELPDQPSAALTPVVSAEQLGVRCHGRF